MRRASLNAAWYVFGAEDNEADLVKDRPVARVAIATRASFGRKGHLVLAVGQDARIIKEFSSLRLSCMIGLRQHSIKEPDAAFCPIKFH
jgi:hypothetical protein